MGSNNTNEKARQPLNQTRSKVLRKDSSVLKGNNIKDICRKIQGIISGELTDKHFKVLMVYFLAISLLEISAYTKKGIFSILASRIWIIGGILCIISIMIHFLQSIKQDFIEKKFISIGAVFLLILYLFTIMGNVNLTEINHDATQQVAAGMDSLNFKDFNYTGKAFLGYPNRQYIIAAIPAILFGRSITTLQMGFGLPFILGIMLLYCGLRKWAEKMNIDTRITILPLFAFFTFPFVTEYYMNFEQAIYPISFTMIAIGFFLLILCKPNLIDLFGFAWIGCLFSNSYTPVIASLGLMIVFIGIIACICILEPSILPFSIHSPDLTAKILTLVEVNIISFFIATVLNSRQDRMTVLRSYNHLLTKSYQSIYDFLTDKNARFIGMFGVVVIFYIFASLTFRLKLRDVLISLWIFGVLIVSNLLKGYTSYEPKWIMQRALIVIPVLIVAISITMFDVINKYKIKIGKGMILVIILTFSFVAKNNFNQINQSFIYFNYIQPMKYMLNDLENTAKDNNLDSQSVFNLIMYTDNVLMKNPADYCEFFFPNANIYLPEHDEFPVDIDLDLTTFVYGDSMFSDVVLVESDDLLIFKNKRFHINVAWYKGIVSN
jgi:hypothetical protein